MTTRGNQKALQGSPLWGWGLGARAGGYGSLAAGTSSGTALVTVITAAQAIDQLADIVESYDLQQGISNSLDKKLERAREALEAANAGRRGDEANKLQAFINEVEAQREKELTGAQADELIAWATRVISVL